MKRAWPAMLGAALAALVCLRTLVAFTPQPWFDVDPVLDPSAYAGLGPAGSLLIDAGIAAVSAALLFLFAGRAAMLVTLAALGVVVLRLGSESTFGAIGWRGWNWIVAWIACAAAVAVARNPRQQARLAWSAMVATLLGVCCLWLARGAWQWFQEQPSTVAYFHAAGRDAAFFDDRGWDPTGPQAMSYVRRLEQREMTGWFGLSNIFAGVLAVAAAAIAGLPRSERKESVSWGFLSAACAVAVLMNGSKGAIAALCIGMAAVAVLRWMRVRPGLLVAASLGLVAASALAAVGRALALASVMPGERSLLFRWHYLRTAWSAWREHPLIGTGPEGFKDASARLRPMDAVEIVQSAHAAFADWMSQLGVASLAWITAALAMLVWSARGAAMEPTPLPAPESRDGLAQRITMLAVLVAMAFSLQAEIHTLDATSLMVRLVGGIAWAGTAVTLMPRLWSARSCGAHMLFPAALVMLCQGQVEMTLWNPGSCAWLLVMLGAAVPPHALQPDAEELRRTPRMAWRVTAASAAGFACLVCALGGAAHRRMESAMGDAAAQLAASMRAGSGIEPVKARVNAADALRPWSRLLASDQMLRAAAVQGLGSPEGMALALAAAKDADDAARGGAGLQQASHLDALHAAALAWEVCASASTRKADLVNALQRALDVTAFDPRASAAWLRAARLANALARQEPAMYAVESRVYATAALRADDSFALDPLARLAPRDRMEAEMLAGRVTSPAPASAP